MVCLSGFSVCLGFIGLLPCLFVFFFFLIGQFVSLNHAGGERYDMIISLVLKQAVKIDLHVDYIQICM